jgi:hypothetical protein
MFWWMLAQILSLIFDLATGRQKPHVEKDLEILVLRYHLRILQRTLPGHPHPSPWQRLVLSVVAAKLKNLSRRAGPTGAKACSSSSPRRSFGGIGTWFVAGGPSREGGFLDDHEWLSRSRI